MSSEEDIAELKSHYVGLLFECPCKREASGCPFLAIRDKNVVARVNWLKGLTPAAFRRALMKHNECAAKPVRKKPKKRA